ncbi:MAG: hypothetical protein BMS9Abin07_0567 [Acidimicrobiia bacterium]|nr:MAG: hypothetical protein BMS9Abin07_0567 [Acidimicrobiia bacterium]
MVDAAASAASGTIDIVVNNSGPFAMDPFVGSRGRPGGAPAPERHRRMRWWTF